MNSTNETHNDTNGEFYSSSEIIPAQKNAKLATPPIQFRQIPTQEDADGEEADMSRYIHALRRNWLVGAVIGICLAVPFAAIAWTQIPPQATAVEFVRISPRHVPLLFETADSVARLDFKSYKNTQRQLLTQPFALQKALQNSDVAKLPIVRENADAVGWLQKELKVTFPDEAEMMNVSLTCIDPVSAHLIVNAVVDTYMKDVVDKETAERNNRVEKLEQVLREAEDKVRKKRGELTGLVDSLGTGDSSTLNIAQQASLQQLSLLRSEVSKINFEIMRAKGESQARAAAQEPPAENGQVAKVKLEETAGSSKSVKESISKAERAEGKSSSAAGGQAAVTSGSSDAKSDGGIKEAVAETQLPTESGDLRLEQAIEMDPVASKLTREVERLQALIRQTGLKYDARTAATYIAKYQTQLEETQQKLAERTKRVQRLITEGAPAAGAVAGLTRPNDLPFKISVLERQEAQLRNEMKNLEVEAKKFGRSSIDVEMMRKEIDSLDPLVGRVSEEIERTKIELQSKSRITRYQSNGAPHVSASKKKIPITAAAGMFGFFAPLAFLVFRDSRRNHVNNVRMMNHGVKIAVLGSIPRVPTKIMKRLNDESHVAAKVWRNRIGESVTAVTAMLLRKLAVEGHRVILVSSATAGEGKSTLAEQLARSLADSGHQTLLIDFDLRRPQLHNRLNLPLGPGVSDVLRKGADLNTTVRQTTTPNLNVLTAGNCKGSLLLEASSGTLECFLKDCRAQYEIVVVDSSPLLPVVDGRIVGQFADGAILTVIKDVSQMPQVIAARDVLSDYGIPILGCVVTGDDKDSYYDSYGNSAEVDGIVARGVSATRSMSAM